MSDGPICRICESDDDDELIDGLAAAIWHARRLDGDPDWTTVSEYWRAVMRDTARIAIDYLRAD